MATMCKEEMTVAIGIILAQPVSFHKRIYELDILGIGNIGH